MEKQIYYCRDCKKVLETVEGEIIGGKCLVYQDGEEKINIIKCDQCYAKDPSLANYKKTEVYSRIVGYLRPINQWNKGKQEEYSQRKEYKIPKTVLAK